MRDFEQFEKTLINAKNSIDILQEKLLSNKTPTEPEDTIALKVLDDFRDLIRKYVYYVEDFIYSYEQSKFKLA